MRPYMYGILKPFFILTAFTGPGRHQDADRRNRAVWTIWTPLGLGRSGRQRAKYYIHIGRYYEEDAPHRQIR